MALKIGAGLGAAIGAKVELPKPVPAAAKSAAAGAGVAAHVDGFDADPGRLVSAAKALGEGVWSLTQRAVEWGEKKASELIDNTPLRDKVDAVNPQKQVEQLQPGDTYKVGIDVSGSIEAANGGVHADTTVTARAKTHPDGTPVLGPDGKPQVEYVVTKGTGLTGGAGTNSTSATLGGDGKVEMVVDSPEDAVKAMQLLNRPVGGNPTPGGVDPATFTPEEQEFMRQHTTALELSGTAALQAAKALGIKIDDSVNLSGGASANGQGTLAVRINLGPDGRATSVTVKQSLSIDGGMATVGTGQNGSSRTQKLAVSGTVEDTFTFPPPGVSGSELMKDPSGTLSKIASGTTRATTLTVTTNENHGAEGNEVEIKISGKPADVLSPELIDRARKGDLPGALRDAGDKLDVQLTVSHQKRTGLDVDVNLGVFEGKAVAQRTENRPVLTRKGTASDVADTIDQVSKSMGDDPWRVEANGKRLAAQASGR